MSAVLGSAPPLPASRWRWPLVALVLVVVALLGLYRDTVVAMVIIWYRSETFAHCFLVPPISAWLAWRSRSRLSALAPAPQPWLLVAIAVAVATWWLGDMASVNAVTQFAVTALLVLSVPALLGLAVARVLAFPLLFLFFMVPVGEFLLPTFMEWTADFTIAAVRLSGIPVYREGLNFVIPSGSWSVVEACSGVRYMIASLMVGSLFAYLNYSSLRRRLIFCAVALLVPLVANWLRAYMIVMLGHLSGNKLAVGVDHLIYGWVFFGIVIGLMFMIGARWAEPPAAPVESRKPTVAAAPAPYAGWVPLAAMVLISLPHLASWQAAPSGSGKLPPLTLPALAGAPAAQPSAVLEPRNENPGAVAMQHYRFDDGEVTVHVAWYARQVYGSKVVSSNNVLVSSDDKQWRKSSDGLVAGWQSAEVLQGFVSASASRGLRLDARRAYWVDGRFTPSAGRAVLHGLVGRLKGHGDSGAVVTIYTSGESPSQTGRRLDRFLQQHLPAIEASLLAYRAEASR